MDEDVFQHHSLLPRSADLEPEKRLMLAVLEQAVETFQKYCLSPAGSHGEQVFQEVDRWLKSNNTHWPFSFVNICGVLALDVSYLRRGLAEWRQKLYGEAVESMRAKQLRRSRV